MPARYFIRVLLIFFILLSFAHLCYADVNEEVQKYTEAQKYYDEGKNYFNTGQYEKAVEAFKEAIKIKQDFVEAHYNLGVIYNQLGQDEKAIASYEEAIKIDPDFYKAHHNLALICLTLEQYEKAEKAFKEVIRIKPDATDVIKALGILYQSLGKHEKAVEAFNKVLKIKPDIADADIYFRLGLVCVLTGKNENAIRAFEEVIKLKPDFADAYYNSGFCYNSLGQHDRAIEFINKAIAITPSANYYNELGSAYLDLKQYEKAIESYQNAIELAPDNAGYYHNIALAYEKVNNIKKATEYLEKAVKIKPDLINTHLLLATTYGGRLGQYEDAIRAYKEVIRLNPDNDDAYYGMGLVYGNLKQYEKAIESFKQVLRIKPDYTDAHYMLGLAYGSLSQNEKAIESYKKTIELKPDHVDAYYFLGINYQGLEQYEKAIESYKEAIRIKPDYNKAYKHLMIAYHKLSQDDEGINYLQEAMKKHPDVAEPPYSLGFYYYMNGKLKDAIDYLETALNLYKKSSNKKYEAKASFAIGEIYMNLGKDIYAINHFQNALKLYEGLNDSEGIAGAYNDIALIYFQLADYSTALEFFQKALGIYEKLEDNLSILRIRGAITRIKSSIAKQSSGNYEETIKYGKQVIEFAEKNGLASNYNSFAAYVAVGMAYWESEDYKTAIIYGNKLLEISQLTDFKVSKALSHLLMGMANIKLENYKQALEYLQKAYALSKDLDHASLKWMCSWGFGQHAEKSENIVDAKRHYLNAINLVESAREDTQSLASKISMGIQTKDIYKDTILFLLKINENNTAFNYMQKAKSRSFLDLLGGKLKLQSVKAENREIIEKERGLQFKINYLSEKIRDINEPSQKTDAPQLEKDLLEKELNDARAEHAALLEKIKKDYPELSSLLVVNTLTLQEVQNILDSDTTLLEYYITPDKTLLWVVSKSDLNVIQIEIKDKELTSKVEAYREKIANLNPDYGKDADELYNLLIKPAKEHIKTKRIGIVPHSILHYLPFHALLNKDKFLIEEYEMFYTPSASVLKFVYEKRKKVTDKVLAFGNPDIGDEKLNLPYAEDEVKKIKDTYPESVLYLKENATEEKVKALSGDYSIIHFASHGELNPDAPLSSSIRLAKDKDEDGRLEVNEIFNLDLKNTSLVTLSACETGLGKLTQGDELVGLTRGFIYAGTPSIVASLWSVNDQSTSELMSLFYKNLKSYPKSEALRMAQLEMIRGKTGKGIVRGVGGITTSKEGKSKLEDKTLSQTSETVDGSHPYFWAPFILLGDWK